MKDPQYYQYQYIASGTTGTAGESFTAEIVAERYGVSREDQDAYALQSQQRYAAAVDAGWMAEEIVPMKATMHVIDKATGEELARVDGGVQLREHQPDLVDAVAPD